MRGPLTSPASGRGYHVAAFPATMNSPQSEVRALPALIGGTGYQTMLPLVMLVLFTKVILVLSDRVT